MKPDFFSDINRWKEELLGYPEVDRLMVVILEAHLFFLLLLVGLSAVLRISLYLPSPVSWRIISPTEAFVSVVIGVCAVLFPLLLRGRMPARHYYYRILVTISLTTFSYLFVFLSGGSIEMHFHFFIIAALLIIYSDWRLGWILLVLTAVHHGVLNYLAPGWVYEYGRNDFAVLAHSVPLLTMVIFTTILSERGRRATFKFLDNQKGLTLRTFELERLKTHLEESVAERTTALKEKVSELERTNKLMIDRELKMVELKKENEKLRSGHAHEVRVV